MSLLSIGYKCIYSSCLKAYICNFLVYTFNFLIRCAIKSKKKICIRGLVRELLTQILFSNMDYFLLQKFDSGGYGLGFYYLGDRIYTGLQIIKRNQQAHYCLGGRDKL